MLKTSTLRAGRVHTMRHVHQRSKRMAWTSSQRPPPAAMSRSEFDTPGCPTAPQVTQARPASEGQILRVGTCSLGITSIDSWRTEALERLAKAFNQFETN